MSDLVQLPTMAPAVARIAPVRVEPPVEPVKPPQTEHRNARDQRESARQDRPSYLPADRHLTITRDENLRTYVYRSIDADSGEVVWQWPAEYLLRRAQQMRAMEEKQFDDRHTVDELA